MQQSLYERTEDGVTVIDQQTGEVHIAQEYKPYKIIMDGKPRYFKEQHIDNYLKRKQEALPDQSETDAITSKPASFS